MGIYEQSPIEPIPRLHFIRAFSHKNFRLFFTGQLISLIGTWAQSLAISWLVWQLTSKTLWLGIAGFALQFPMLIFGLHGGVIADRVDRLKALTLLQVLCMLEAILLAVLTIFGWIKLWHVLGLSVMLGTIYAFEFPIRMSFMSDMVGRADLLNAISLNAAMFHATRILGPMVAGAIIVWKGEGVCFLFNAATFIVLIVTLMLIDRKLLIRYEHPIVKAKDPITEGLKFAFTNKELMLALFLACVVSVFGFPFIYLLPAFADHVFGGGSVELSWLMGASGVGALFGSLWLAARKTSEKILSLAAIASLLFSIFIILFCVTNNIFIALPLLAISGAGLTITLSGINTFIQQSAHDHMRGRLISMFSTIFMGFAPIGSLLGGALAGWIGPQLTVALFGIICTPAAIVVWGKTKN